MSLPATSGPAVLRTARTYPGTPDQIRVVRVDIRALADGCPLAEDIVLCASELATNAVMHSDSGMPWRDLRRPRRDPSRQLRLGTS